MKIRWKRTKRNKRLIIILDGEIIINRLVRSGSFTIKRRKCESKF